MEKQAYSIREFREQTGIGRNLAYKLIETGKIKTIRVGRRILIPAWAFEEFLRKVD